jgi:hypothetical protein
MVRCSDIGRCAEKKIRFSSCFRYLADPAEVCRHCFAVTDEVFTPLRSSYSRIYARHNSSVRGVKDRHIAHSLLNKDFYHTKFSFPLFFCKYGLERIQKQFKILFCLLKARGCVSIFLVYNLVTPLLRIRIRIRIRIRDDPKLFAGSGSEKIISDPDPDRPGSEMNLK